MHILITGSTGYIGGSVLSHLIQHPDRQSHEIVSYLRNEEKANKLQEFFGIKSIIGTLDNSQKIEDAAAQADVVIHTADSADHLGSAEAILRGLKRRHEQTSKVPFYIHTSGTGVIVDDAKGLHGNHIVYDDSDVEQIKSIPDDAMHRNVDLTLIAADAEGYVRTYIILPSTIYGIASGPIFDAKLANPHSVQVPVLIKSSVERGRAGMVGEGKNIWPHVHIDDVADLFIVLFDSIVADPEKAGHGWEGFYFGENGSYTFFELATTIGKTLVKMGKAQDETPTTYTKEELDKYFGGSDALGTNSLCRATRGRKLGWKPKYTTDDFHASVLPETEAITAPNAVPLRWR